MGRREKPVDRTVPACAKLADFLRGRKAAAGLTHEEMSKRVNGVRSKATFERAASGASVPRWETVEAFINVTVTKEEEFAATLGVARDRGLELWIQARRATRAPYYVHKAPNPKLVSSEAGFIRALRHQHMWAGYPAPGEMERMSGPGELPSSTTRRIIEGDILPVDPQQAIAFLKACFVRTSAELEPWLGAAVRALTEGGESREKDLNRWVKAHQDLLVRINASNESKELAA
ncbi:helix-turn-helix domain-containing protein [Streptomyces europaeiscabiei]|uniref:helix-turn-helix domain-containing protein n=1 Tax=Streptomyces europaeiscabiei TaxID=146819 RepID=UPI000AEDA008|nr:helix-turn-helix transcriptional regulator [Streptomyces europaeiscabiei]MDX3673347.1 helix-turn-helix transcriptional regulator [Streptomyces europaeiscabiei]MDX3716138.1 helix-turn-helix transcriptional regulator [Streptomyces europaeiscabiei]MDX3839629.1 helix-turn-helix transcriptional regulator [Streptomyces europaeiscabiei]MDX3847851.1 helix-turn-helix transcriptional regulator [Streptomyces europaeiscabiei]MDX3867055.1 helix-turn-helix transcriptional regulator [Streptomyces europaei